VFGDLIVEMLDKLYLFTPGINLNLERFNLRFISLDLAIDLTDTNLTLVSMKTAGGTLNVEVVEFINIL